MRFNHSHTSLRKNARVVGHPAVRVCRLIRDRRAASAVISNIILIAAVIAIGFAVLAYVNSTSSSYVFQYGETVNSDIDKLKETVAFEYAFYNATTEKLYVYFMNAGKVNNVNVTTIYVRDSLGNPVSLPPELPSMRYLVNNETTTKLDIGEEGYMVLSPQTPLTSGDSYVIKITTWRDSSFEYNFAA